MKGLCRCEYEYDGTLIVKVPQDIAEQCHRISLHHAGTTFTTLFTECGAAFGMEMCNKEGAESEKDSDCPDCAGAGCGA